MLVVVLILVSAFMRASIFNINFSQDELDQKKAFYAAEAGIEDLINRAYVDDEGAISGLEDLLDDEFYFYDDEESHHYTVKEDDEDDPDNYTYKSTGHFNEVSASIYIDIVPFLAEEPIQVQSGQDADELLSGQAKKMYEDGYISIREEMSPPERYWYGWIDDKLDDENVNFESPEEDYKYDSGDKDYDYAVDSNDDFYDKYEDFHTDEYRLNFNLDEDLDDDGEDWEGLDAEEAWKEWQEENEEWFDSATDFYETFFGYKSNEYLTVYHRGDITLGAPGGGQFPDDDYEENLINTILVVDGDVTIRPQIRIHNSIVILRDGLLKFTGSPTEYLSNSMFYIYQQNFDVEDDDPEDPQVAGNYESWLLDDLPEFDEDIFDIDKHTKIAIPDSWRYGN